MCFNAKKRHKKQHHLHILRLFKNFYSGVEDADDLKRCPECGNKKIKFILLSGIKPMLTSKKPSFYQHHLHPNFAIITWTSVCKLVYQFLTRSVKFRYNSNSSETSIFNHQANLHSGVYVCPKVVRSFLTITEKKKNSQLASSFILPDTICLWNLHSKRIVNFHLCKLRLWETYCKIICKPKNALNKIQFMTNINILHVSAPGAILRESFRSEECKPITLY